MDGFGDAEATEAPAVQSVNPFADAEKVSELKDWVKPVAYDYARFGGGAGINETDTWGASGHRYEWLEEYGDVGPKVPELELMLYGPENRTSQGREMHVYEYNVIYDGTEQLKPIKNVSCSPTFVCLSAKR